MLKLENIIKDYVIKVPGKKNADTITHALKGVSLDFRENEFVAILGPSGCGKTTLLNIVGGLDRYTDGDIFVNGISTKTYDDRDWDTYRNHSVGFVFQTYNLIEHQTVIANVELALTMSGLDRAKCREMAMQALDKVGIADQAQKKPNQLSGGQMQRVAIARAIVNNPDIILADEPTGALDTETSVQIMEILKELSHENLIIMVTHNPELANQYATRIIRLTDGLVTDDSNPFVSPQAIVDEAAEAAPIEGETEIQKMRRRRAFLRRKRAESYRAKREKRKKAELTSMKYSSAFRLSFSNLITKRGRTILTSLAGSVGIIGITLVLSLSAGFGAYIRKTEEDSLSRYPLTITKTNMDLRSALGILMDPDEQRPEYPNDSEVYVGKMLANFIENLSSIFSVNDTRAFKSYLDANFDDRDGFVKYSYGTEMYIFTDYAGVNAKINPFLDRVKKQFEDTLNRLGIPPEFVPKDMMDSIMAFSEGMTVWDELIENQTLLDSQYELLGASRWPTEKDEIVLVIDKRNQITDFMLFALGLKSPDELLDALGSTEDFVNTIYLVEELLNLEYMMLRPCDFYEMDEGGVWHDYTTSADDSPEIARLLEEKSLKLKVVGVVRPKSDTAGGAINGAAGFSKKLTDWIIESTPDSEIVQAQAALIEAEDYTNVVTGEGMGAEEYAQWLYKMGVADLDEPDAIYIYANTFEGKDNIIALIDRFNALEDEPDIKYTDTLGLLMSSTTKILNSVTYILVGFSAISLIVSSIMIAIVIYTSVLERTKEIGVLRSIGARKKDVARVFISESMMIGFASGVIGVLFTFIIQYPVSAILYNILNIKSLMSMVWWHALVMITLSVTLSLLAGVVPSQMAANKDPVIALRSE